VASAIFGVIKYIWSYQRCADYLTTYHGILMLHTRYTRLVYHGTLRQYIRHVPRYHGILMLHTRYTRLIYHGILRWYIRVGAKKQWPTTTSIELGQNQC